METLQGSEPHITIPGKPYPVTVLGYPARMIGPATTYESVSDQIGDVPLKHQHQTLHRGDDLICSHLCGPLSAAAPGPAVDFLFSAAVSGHHGAVAAISQSAGVGRLCGQHLFHRFTHFLVRGSGS